MPRGVYNHYKIIGENNPAKRQDVKEKISLANKGKKLSEEHKMNQSETMKKLYAEGKIVNPMKGKHHSEESKNRNKMSHLGKIAWNKGLTKETDERVMKYSKPKTEEHKQKISESNKGKHEYLQGIKFSEEHKTRLSDSLKGKCLGLHRSPETEFKRGTVPFIKGKNHDAHTRKIMSSKKKNLFDKIPEIVELYTHKKMSTRDLARTYNCSKTSIRYILKNNQVQLRKGHTPEGDKKISDKLKGREFSDYTLKKMSASKQGIFIEEWKKFISREPYSQNWDLRFKNQIRKRDNQICMNCGIHREKLKRALDSHHVNYDKQLTILENCISLCRKCHILTNTNREYWKRLFQEKLSKLYGYKYDEKGNVIIDLSNPNPAPNTSIPQAVGG